MHEKTSSHRRRCLPPCRRRRSTHLYSPPSSSYSCHSLCCCFCCRSEELPWASPCPPRLPSSATSTSWATTAPLLHALSQQHGPLMLLRLGQVPVLVVSSPDAAREVLRNQDGACAGRPALKAARILLYGCKDLAFAPYGDYWKQLRKICSVHLLSPMRVQSYRLMRGGGGIHDGKDLVPGFGFGERHRLIRGLVLFRQRCTLSSCFRKFTEKKENRLFSDLVGENSVLLSKIYVVTTSRG
ncbi:unnamed protein product [Musa acuminata subsp. burmannicoides]